MADIRLVRPAPPSPATESSVAPKEHSFAEPSPMGNAVPKPPPVPREAMGSGPISKQTGVPESTHVDVSPLGSESTRGSGEPTAPVKIDPIILETAPKGNGEPTSPIRIEPIVVRNGREPSIGFEEAPTGETNRVPSWRPRQSLPAQATYGRFELLGRIARGGMAEILLAREMTALGTSRHVVVKRIVPTAADDETFVRMFIDEARLLMGLVHPEICHVYDFGKQDGTWFIAMEWVNGVPLAKISARARKKGGFGSPLVARIVAQVAGALHAAHNAKDPEGKPLGIVHRDVSPHNIMVAYDGSVKLLDFGIAKATLAHDRTRAGVIKGKFAYMAPEQCVGGDLDGRADVFALGICLYEALTGRALFRRPTEYETLRAVVQDAAPPLRRVDPTLPEGLEKIVKKALEKKRENRYRSAQEMQLAIESWLAEDRQIVTGANLARMMRRLFASEIRKGPELSAISTTLPATTAEPKNDDPEVTIEPAESTGTVMSAITGSAIATRPRAPWLVVLAAAVLVVSVVGVTKLVNAPLDPTSAPRTPAPVVQPAPPPSAPTPEAHAAPIAPVPVAAAPVAVEEPPEATRAREPRATARLSLNTRPWSKVYVGSRLLGTTPIGNARVPAGRVQLRLVDRDGRTHRRVANVAANGQAELFYDLSE